jgi:hypothetical protein
MPDINSIQTGDSGSAEFDVSTVDFDEASDTAFLVDVIGCTLTINYDPTRDTHLSTARSEQSDQNTENEAAEPNPQHVATLTYEPDGNGGEKFRQSMSGLPVQKQIQAIRKTQIQDRDDGVVQRLNLAYTALNEQDATSNA